MGDSQREHNKTRGGLKHCSIGVSIIKARKLSISLSKKTGLETINRFVGQMLCAKDPFRTYDVHFGKSTNKIPTVVVTESFYFFIHSCKPFRIFSSGLETSWLRGSKERR